MTSSDYTPGTRARQFYGNGECFVLAASIRAALDAVEAEWPGCTFIAVHKRSRNLPILVASAEHLGVTDADR